MKHTLGHYLYISEHPDQLRLPVRSANTKLTCVSLFSRTQTQVGLLFPGTGVLLCSVFSRTVTFFSSMFLGTELETNIHGCKLI